MTDNPGIEKENPVEDPRSKNWLADLSDRVKQIEGDKSIPNKSEVIQALIISRTGGDATNPVFPFVSYADTDNGITEDLYDRAINGFNVTWFEVSGAIENYKKHLSENVKTHYENEILGKYQPIYQQINDPSFDKSKLTSLFMGPARDFAMELHGVQTKFVEEMKPITENENLKHLLLY